MNESNRDFVSRIYQTITAEFVGYITFFCYMVYFFIFINSMVDEYQDIVSVHGPLLADHLTGVFKTF